MDAERIYEAIRNNYKIFLLIFILVIFDLGIIITIRSNNTFAAVNNDSVSIECPAEILYGRTATCNIKVNFASFTSGGFSALYDSSSGLTYSTFTPSSNFETISANSKGFVVASKSGDLSGTVDVGNIVVSAPGSGSEGQLYTAGIKSATAATSTYTDKTLGVDSAVMHARTPSTVNTISSITLSSGKINETVSDDVTSYTATVEDSSVDITIKKTDVHSTSTWTKMGVSLNYGKNVIKLTVTSEVGTSKEYTITITRPYTFNQNYYKYDASEKYIYTKNDSTHVILTNLNLQSVYRSYITDDSQLVLEDATGSKLFTAKLVGFSTDYTVAAGSINTNGYVSYGTFMSKIKGNGVTIKVVDSNGKDVTSGDIMNSYKVLIYYKDTLLETYGIVIDYLDLSGVKVDESNKVIYDVKAGMLYSEFKGKIKTSGDILIEDSSGVNMSDSSKVKTGDSVVINMSDKTIKYKISVLGDVVGDGEILINDISRIFGYYRYPDNDKTFSIENKYAADVVPDGRILINDVSKLYAYYRKVINSLEVTE